MKYLSRAIWLVILVWFLGGCEAFSPETTNGKSPTGVTINTPKGNDGHPIAGVFECFECTYDVIATNLNSLKPEVTHHLVVTTTTEGANRVVIEDKNGGFTDKAATVLLDSTVVAVKTEDDQFLLGVRNDPRDSINNKLSAWILVTLWKNPFSGKIEALVRDALKKVKQDFSGGPIAATETQYAVASWSGPDGSLITERVWEVAVGDQVSYSVLGGTGMVLPKDLLAPVLTPKPGETGPIPVLSLVQQQKPVAPTITGKSWEY